MIWLFSHISHFVFTRTLLPLLVKASLLNKKAVKIGNGSPTWSAVHVEFLGEVFTWLFEQAADGGGKAEWNDKGWYFVENDTYVS